ncbi:GTP-binding protein [Kurthia sp. 3B1D]|uniref:GTPase HflX n=2 Tax=Kurthia TaxID=1649 RepID=A0A433RQX9_9BACL|nr:MULTISPECIES: GTPase HflX [unclassified Kurthia]RUS53189.1 GTP-binding protein [Kurthia sp. 3B1D]HIX43179.1 GTPase HflX [Candidatus Kurthia intestinigallinarum]
MEENIKERAILVGVNIRNDRHFDYSIEELGNLAEALDVEVVGVITQNLERVTPSHYVGTGKILEIRELYDALDANVIIFDDELSPAQLRNLEHDIDAKVIDRTTLVLDIFARRAKTREAQLQVEIAQLQYLMPRLVGMNASLSRQGGGTGGGFQNKGSGETKLELDRRKIEKQISKIRRELDEIQAQRSTQRKKRQKNAIPVVSLVGYTNAGKSTIMNQLLARTNPDEEKQVFEKDMLFATLDTSVRQIELEDNKRFLLTDTVGFVSKLPHHLVKAFRSTLEEAREADLLLHVVDTSNAENAYMVEITNNTLSDVGVGDVPTIFVYNKADRANIAYPYVNQNQIYLSAKDGQGLDELLEMIKKEIFSDYEIHTVCIPYDRGDLVSYLNEHANILSTDYDEAGTVLKVDLKVADVNRMRPFFI